VRVLDVGQGDAIMIENGGSQVLIDGGPEPSRFARLLDRFGLSGDTIDAVILTHQHYDHYAGLRELFRSSRRITVRYVFENKDPYSNTSLAQLRDSIIARARRGTLDYRDTDDPCGTGAPECTITLRGGARLHLLRPDPRGEGPNNRSAVVKLIAPDSAAFTMWLAGDAEQQEISWFDATEYDKAPGMRATVLKGDHHGSCDGISPRYLDLVRPEVVLLSLASKNDYGYVHEQTLDLLQARRIPWYRTDQNGTLTITVPRHGAKYSVSAERGGPDMRGPSDRPARHCGDESQRATALGVQVEIASATRRCISQLLCRALVREPGRVAVHLDREDRSGRGSRMTDAEDVAVLRVGRQQPTRDRGDAPSVDLHGGRVILDDVHDPRMVPMRDAPRRAVAGPPRVRRQDRTSAQRAARRTSSPRAARVPSPPNPPRRRDFR
jgi:competence protein ComEC